MSFLFSVCLMYVRGGHVIRNTSVENLFVGSWLLNWVVEMDMDMDKPLVVFNWRHPAGPPYLG